MYAIIYVSGTERRTVPLDDLGRDLTDRDPHDRALRAEREALRADTLPTLDATSVSVEVCPAAWPLHSSRSQAN
jgi:hypothetical protein